MTNIGNHVPFNHEDSDAPPTAAAAADKVLLIGGGGFVGMARLDTETPALKGKALRQQPAS